MSTPATASRNLPRSNAEAMPTGMPGKPEKRRQSLREELVNALTHGVGALVSVSAVTLLIVLTSLNRDAWEIVSVSIYGGTLFLLLMVSTLYHAIQHQPTKSILSLIDHCAIYLLIAGTYTPFLLGSLRSTTSWVLFGVIWGLALTGIVLKLLVYKKFHAFHVINYLAMGWIGLLIAPDLMAQISGNAFSLVVAGGIVYTVGVLFYVLERIPFCHSIWHLFVLGGCTCHFIAVFADVVYTGS